MDKISQAFSLINTIFQTFRLINKNFQARLTIPANISLPLFDVCNRLGLKPIVCHASACLANWKPIQEMIVFDAAMIDIITFRFIQHPGNRWFFTLTAQVSPEKQIFCNKQKFSFLFYHYNYTDRNGIS